MVLNILIFDTTKFLIINDKKIPNNGYFLLKNDIILLQLIYLKLKIAVLLNHSAN